MEKINQLKAQLAKDAELADAIIKENPACSSAVSVRGRLNGVTEMIASLERELAAQPKPAVAPKA